MFLRGREQYPVNHPLYIYTHTRKSKLCCCHKTVKTKTTIIIVPHILLSYFIETLVYDKTIASFLGHQAFEIVMLLLYSMRVNHCCFDFNGFFNCKEIVSFACLEFKNIILFLRTYSVLGPTVGF